LQGARARVTALTLPCRAGAWRALVRHGARRSLVTVPGAATHYPAGRVGRLQWDECDPAGTSACLCRSPQVRRAQVQYPLATQCWHRWREILRRTVDRNSAGFAYPVTRHELRIREPAE